MPGTLYSRLLAPGYTVAQYQAAVLDLMTEAWGAPTYYNVNSSSPYGYNYLEWPDFGGVKHAWFRSGTTSMRTILASEGYFSGSNRLYRNTVFGSGFAFSPSNTAEPAYLVAVASEHYRVFAYRNSGTTRAADAVGLLAYPAPYWGSASRAYESSDGTNFDFLPGLNPWGALDAAGNASPGGITRHSIERPSILNQNSLLGKGQITTGSALYNAEATVGAQFEDFGYLAYVGLDGYFNLAETETELFLTIPSGVSGWSVAVDKPPFENLPVYPAYRYDIRGSEGDTGQTIVKPHPSQLITKGQIYPNPHGLPVPQSNS